MSNKYVFDLKSDEHHRPLPRRMTMGQGDNETVLHSVLKLLGFILFFRERLEVGGKLHNDNIPFDPDIVQLDYTLRPVLWIECGDCGVNKLNKLAVKVPDAEIWILKSSPLEAQTLITAMRKEELRKDRYNLIGFDPDIIQELCDLVRPRNELFWLKGSFEPAHMEFDFNGLWFDTSFTVLRH